MPRGASSLAVAMWIVALVAFVFLLRAASQLFIPIIIAVLISYALEPVVAWLAGHHIPRPLGAAALLAVILGLSGWGAYTLRDDAREAIEALPEAARRARSLVWSGSASSPARQVEKAAEVLQPEGGKKSGGQSPEEAPPGGALGPWVQRVMGSVLALVGHLTVIVFLTFFLLMSGGHFKKRIVEIAGPPLESRRITATIIDEINAQVQRFLLVHLVTAIIVAAATWAVLAGMGVRQAAVWGILAGIFNTIPYFGPVIVSGGLLVVGLVQSADPALAVKMAGAALLITSLEGWLITPPLMGKAERMHVVVVFLGVLVWTWIWGGWGTILAVPMLVIVKAIADHVDSLKPVSRLMAP